MTSDNGMQEMIDDAWSLYNRAMEACDELMGLLDEIEAEYEVDLSRAQEAAGEAHAALDGPYSTGAPVLPPHSTDRKAKT